MVTLLVPLLLLIPAPQAAPEETSPPTTLPTTTPAVVSAVASPAPNLFAPAAQPITWEFDFAFLDPQRIEVQLPGEAETTTYWYMVYTVTNNTGRTRHFLPRFQIVTEDLDVYDTDMGISPLVFDAIRERHKLTHKYLVSPTAAIGPLRTGPDYARESVAVWREIDLTQNSFRVYVAGLSGEIRFIPNPAYDPEAPETVSVIGPAGYTHDIVVNPKRFTLRKTLEIRYTLPGSPAARPASVPERGEIRWIMR